MLPREDREQGFWGMGKIHIYGSRLTNRIDAWDDSTCSVLFACKFRVQKVEQALDPPGANVIDDPILKPIKGALVECREANCHRNVYRAFIV